ncbi:Ral guanine nucleotide dissociation stimulator-like 1 [Armadillidium nasatum]|uniref:Ral guanine nucleotide dissociation stimulator-like 1 n=1 Tax=Armadillidium nasatum TaxID=96803 RepID=A0A5N5SNV7_9CRUS|nr:Ral guanine nucleotide dissociation stimulator-like 1 [Armadillidium nasatum]
MLDRYVALVNADPNSVCMGIPPHLHEAHKKAIRLTLQVWLDTYIDDFRDPPLFSSLSQIQEFAKVYLPDSDLSIKINHKMNKLKKEDEAKNSHLLGRILSVNDLNISFPAAQTNGYSQSNSTMNLPYEFLCIPETIFAQQLTRMDAVLFQKLIPHQCLGSIWSQREKARANASPTVVATIEQFNAVIYRVQSTVLVETDLRPSQRARLITKWIDVAQELRLLKNFSSLKAIISSLQSNPLYRLKKTWNAVSKEKFELYLELARIFSEENNQLNQRELLMKEGTAKHAETAHADDRHLPKAIEKMSINPLAVNHGTIPYLGTFLTDLTMIDTAIPDTIDSGLINFDKKRKEFEVLAQIRLLQGAANAYHFEIDDRFERWWDSVLVLDGKEVFDLSCQIEPEGSSSTPSSAKGGRSKSLGHVKNNSIGENSIVSSNDSFIINHSDASSVERKLSTSSNSSLPSVNMSVHSSGTSISPSTPEKTPRSSIHNSEELSEISSQTSLSPYINQDFYIIKVSVESEAHEVEGVNLYKSIYVNNSERTPSVIEKAMQKHDMEGDPKDYTLAQILPDGEMILPQTVNVYYAIKLTHELKFVLRRRRHGDENTIIRRNPAKNHKNIVYNNEYVEYFELRNVTCKSVQAARIIYKNMGIKIMYKTFNHYKANDLHYFFSSYKK